MNEPNEPVSLDLRDTLTRRAERADHALTPDPDQIIDLVRHRVARRARTRRNVAAAGGGAVLVAALVVGLSTLSPAEHPKRDGNAAGGPQPGSSSAPPSPSRASAAAAAAAAAAASAAAAVSARASTSAASPTTTLVPVAPAPAQAEVSIGLIPAGWVYLGSQPAVTSYAPKSTPRSALGDFEGMIVVDVHERLTPDGPNSLRITGRPARYGTSEGYQTVSVIVNATTEMDIQVAPEAKLTRTQVLRIAATLDLRSTKEKTRG